MRISCLMILSAFCGTTWAEPAPADLWETLADPDPKVAYPALWALADRPEESVPLIRENMALTLAPDEEQLNKLIENLSSGVFRIREKATAELAALGPSVEPALRKEIEKPELSAESRRRLEVILSRLPESPTRLRQRRAIQVLEYAGTPKALALLKELAGGQEKAWLTEQASGAVTRLERRGR